MATHNYLEKLARVLRSVQLAQEGPTYVEIQHDDWCSIWRSRHCNCDPILKVCRDGQGRRA